MKSNKFRQSRKGKIIRQKKKKKVCLPPTRLNLEVGNREKKTKNTLPSRLILYAKLSSINKKSHSRQERSEKGGKRLDS